MTETKLWGVSTKGNVFTLSTKGRQWQQVPNQEHCLRGFKQVAVSPQGAWGLGCDHLIYVYVAPSDLPIRCQEVTFENERWLLTRGWSGNHLIPIDPWKWSGRDGTVCLPKEDFKLPSDSWQWEEDWYVDENVQGQLTDKGGWRYGSIDFHGQFTHQKTFRSLVRRRRWIRHRRYIATNRWTRIPSIHIDPLEEPIIDLSLGGHNIPHQKQGHVSVWVVTINGRLLYRNNVHQHCPEGRNWQHIPTSEHEILSVGVGPTGLVWAVSWNGAILVRTGVSWKNVIGKDWVEVEPPDDLEDRVVQVAVGVNSVWITTNSGKMWFRNGVHANSDSISQEGAKGTGWLKMVHSMRTVFVGGMDQVWGIDREERRLYFRKGLTHDEPTGRSWATIDLPYTGHTDSEHGSICNWAGHADSESLSLDDTSMISRESSCAFSDTSPVKDEENRTSQHSATESTTCLSPDNLTIQVEDAGGVCVGVSDSDKDKVTNGGQSSQPATDTSPQTAASVLQSSNSFSSAFSEDTVDYVWDYKSSGEEDGKKDARKDSLVKQEAKKPSKKDSIKKEVKNVLSSLKHTIQNKTHSASGPDAESVSYKVESDTSGSATKLEFKTGTPTDSPGTSTWHLDQSQATAAEAESDTGSEMTASLPPDSLDVRMDTYPGEEGEEDEDYVCDLTESPTEEGALQWQWVSPTNCLIHHDSSVRQWFTLSPQAQVKGSEVNGYQRQISQSNWTSWRDTLIKLLASRADREVAPFISTYQLAVEKSQWTKKGEMKWWRDIHRPLKWADCQVELTQHTGDKAITQGSFCLQYQHKNHQKYEQFSLSHIVCIAPLMKKSQNAIFGVFTEERLKATPRMPPIQFSTSSEGLMEDWISALTVACCDERGLSGAPQAGAIWGLTDRGDVMVHEMDSQYITETTPSMFWHQLGGHMAKVETNCLGITWAIGYNGTAWVYTGGYGGGFFQGINSSPSGLYPQTDTRTVHVYENQRWRPVRGYTEKVLLVDHYMWSDETGKHERTKDGTKLYSKHWQWTGDWAVDRTLPGGMDKDGWQYGYNFTSKFYSRPRLRSYLRRRRWVRKYKVSTVGPWLEVGPLPLQDISIQMDPGQNSESDSLAIWAIGGNGDVLCRVQVSVMDPQGQAWHHIPTDVPFASISIGCCNRVWATARDGSAWYRNGVTTLQPAGTCWFHVPPPEGVHLTQISAGQSHVYAVDSRKNLWFRKDITTTFPEGTQWVKVAGRVRHVSVGPSNQVWAIIDGVSTRYEVADGVVCRRVGTSADDPKSGSWQNGIGGGWNYICARGWDCPLNSP